QLEWQEKRYRSMQEHIRRAHPEHYISKLPATEESFQLMINTPPSARPPQQSMQALGNNVFGHERDAHPQRYTPAAPSRSLEDAYPAAATAAVALAQLHNTRPDSDWESEAENLSENESMRPKTQSSIELPPLQNHLLQNSVPPFHSPRPRELLPSALARSPPGQGRSSTLPPIQRKDNKPTRPRKSSVTQNARKPKHERTKSKEFARRLSVEGRKAFSAEPPVLAMGKRWEDLIEAATSANEADSDRDLTPIPQSPSSVKRASLPPFASTVNHFDSYKASPLQNSLTLTPPPPPSHNDAEPFPSVESEQISSSSHSQQSGHNFHIPSSGLSSINSMHNNSDSSPTFSFSHPLPVQIYCAKCRRVSVLKDSYACTECISGFCSDCVWRLSAEGSTERGCPRCLVVGGSYKPFQLDLR
ncbi:hypothetical protein MMC06_006614, partial [Schaereria dolodes]|nr:hypothetical protein [Schaereria dolodes]